MRWPLGRDLWRWQDDYFDAVRIRRTDRLRRAQLRPWQQSVRPFPRGPVERTQTPRRIEMNIALLSVVLFWTFAASVAGVIVYLFLK